MRGRGGRSGAAALALLTLASVALSAYAPPAGALGEGLEERGAIMIWNLANFTYANGVVGGRGTPADPYVIEGWSIDAHGKTGISISPPPGTGVSIILRNLVIYNSTPSSNNCCSYAIDRLPDGTWIDNVTIRDALYGINLAGSTGMVLTNSTLSNISRVSVSLLDAASAKLAGNRLSAPLQFPEQRTTNASALEIADDNTVDGGPLLVLVGGGPRTFADTSVGQAALYGAENVTFSNVSNNRGGPSIVAYQASNLTVVNSSLRAVKVSDASDVRVIGNTFASPPRGPEAGFVDPAPTAIEIHSVTRVWVERNTVRDQPGGILLDIVGPASVVGNSIENVTYNSLALTYCTDILAVNNTVTNSSSRGSAGAAAVLHGSYNATVSGNTFYNDSGGLSVTYSEAAEIHDNVFANNTLRGLSVSDSYQVNVTHNRVEHNGMGGIELGFVANVNVSGNALIDDGLVANIVEPAWADGVSIAPDNTVNGLPLRAYTGCSNVMLDGVPTGQLLVVNCTGFTASNLSISGPEAPVGFYFVGMARLSGSAIEGGATAIHGYATEGLTLEGNTVTNCSQGILLEAGGGTSVVDNRIINCESALSLDQVEGGRIAGNRIVNASFATLQLSRSLSLTLFGNQIDAGAIALYGSTVEWVTRFEIDESNTIGGRPVRYYKNCSDTLVPVTGAGQIIVANCTRVRMENGGMEAGAEGISILHSKEVQLSNLVLDSARTIAVYIDSSRGVTLSDVSASGAGHRIRYGIYESTYGEAVHVSESDEIHIDRLTARGVLGNAVVSDRTSDLRVSNSVMGDLSGSGIYLTASTRAVITGNEFRNASYGVRAQTDNDRLHVEGNTFEGVRYGVYSASSDQIEVVGNLIIAAKESAIHLRHATAHLVENNTVRDSAIAIEFYNVDGGRIVENNLSGNEVGVFLNMSVRVVVLRNFFFGNAVQAGDNTGRNLWNGSSVEGGNFWSDYTGADRCAGERQDECTRPDGFGDTPRVVGHGPGNHTYLLPPYGPGNGFTNGTDHLPLMAARFPDPPRIPTRPGDPAALGAVEIVQGLLVALLLVVGLSLLWLSLVRVRPRRPPRSGPKGGP